MSKIKYFPSPDEIMSLDKNVYLAVQDVKHKMVAGNFSFSPEYQTSRFFNEIGTLLDEDGWSLTRTATGNWTIEPKGISA